ncbi:MAG: hypothetical protein K0S39_2883, partial [Paenibacillus sp.]|nr:hypothetical protein [Paenibacillus sp.]
MTGNALQNNQPQHISPQHNRATRTQLFR